MAEFDAETEKKLEEVEHDPLSSLEVRHAHARLELREKQLDELAGSMQQLSSEEVCELKIYSFVICLIFLCLSFFKGYHNKLLLFPWK